MELFNFAFRLGVVFAIYGFLWGLFEIGIRLLTSGRERTVGEVYLLRGVKYVFLADVTFLFCIDGDVSNLNYLNQLVLAGIILLTYFVGKLQNNQNRNRMFQVFMNARVQLPKQLTLFNLRAEIAVIVLALLAFSLFNFAPQYAANPISIWFYESIVDIEDTVFFGFIFKVIGFFFLLNLIFKMINGVTFLLSGARPPQDPFDQGGDNGEDNDDFDPWEEVK
ncbi:MAG: hypothetical protein NXI10_07055 [bacterium]|nr:hypothetical protein [bacterium]